MMPTKHKTKRSSSDRPEFFDLYASSDAKVRRQLEEQFRQLSSKLSLVNQRLIESKKLATDPEEFKRFHNLLLDSEFRSAFGITAIVIVYLYKLKETDFDRVYIPEVWDEDKRRFMEGAIRDLRNYHLSGEKPKLLKRKRHLFFDIMEAVKKRKTDPETGTYTRFIRDFGRPSPGLSLATEVKTLFKDEMLIVTPLHNEAGEFWVSVNTYISKEQSLFGRIPEAQQAALTKWYVTVHEAISECFFSVAQLLRLREKALEHDTLKRVSIISYLLSHPSVKLFTTPLKNAADDLLDLHPAFVNPGNDRERFRSIVGNIELITDLWEGNLVVLEEFGAIQDGNEYSLECQTIGSQEWRKIEKALRKAADVLFLSHINDLYDDPNYDDLYQPIVRQGELGFKNFFTLKLALDQGIKCYGHSKLVVLHLISLLENAIEASDFTKAAKQFHRSGTVREPAKDIISYRLHRRGNYGLIEFENNCRVKPCEEENLKSLSTYIKKFNASPREGLYHNRHFAERTFTTKSGTGFGWALILAADYFYRLVVVDARNNRIVRRGSLSLDPAKSNKRTTGLKVTVRFPLIKEANEANERAIVDNSGA